MIISHKHRYIFIEVPHTGCTAIAKDLVENYGGEEIYWKHENYWTFHKNASPEERSYFTFSGVRNPLDEAVSVYLKLKGNHKGNFTNPEKLAVNGGFITKRFMSQYNFVHGENASFAEYFLKFYHRPFNNFAATYHNEMDAVVRFESISEEFKSVRKRIGLDSSEELVKINSTAQKEGYEQYYVDEAVIKRAVYVFGPFMEKWGYAFPANFGSRSVSNISRFHFI